MRKPAMLSVGGRTDKHGGRLAVRFPGGRNVVNGASLVLSIWVNRGWFPCPSRVCETCKIGKEICRKGVPAMPEGGQGGHGGRFAVSFSGGGNNSERDGSLKLYESNVPRPHIRRRNAADGGCLMVGAQGEPILLTERVGQAAEDHSVVSGFEGTVAAGGPLGGRFSLSR